MEQSGFISLFIIIANFVVSYKGFKDHSFYETYSFKVDQLLLYKDYKRLVTSGFLHVSWMHVIFNMLALYFFSAYLVHNIGTLNYLVIYFAGLIGGNLLSLQLHKTDGSYSSVGASGAIAGIIFTSIALLPGLQIGLLFIPISIPAWLFGLIYMLYSIYGIRSKSDNIGHDAHLGGALVGMAVGLLMYPQAIASNYITILIITVPAILFLFIILKRPKYLMVDNLFYNNQQVLNQDDKYNIRKKARQHEIDEILEKIHKKGINSLTKKEKLMLEEFSQ